MDWFLAFLTLVLVITGFLGCFLPVLPGPPLSFIGMLLIHFTRFAQFETSTLLTVGAITIIVQVLDYIVPVWGTKKFGGTKYGTWGSIIGLIVGLFFLPPLGPFGIITVLAGPFFGAYIGETIGGTENNKALRAAFGTFIGFLAGTFMKVVTSVVITVFIVKDIIQTNF
ncbi:MAG: DUF456 domain-containing protein [Bacteroidales bacterium]|nr:DUF456 domain-containing protein [Bacteroidales bacterium]